MNNGSNITKQKACEVNTSQAVFESKKNPTAKIVLKFSAEEQNAQRDFVNILKNLYVEKLKKEMEKSGD